MENNQFITKKLLQYYNKHHRKLPWREDPSPYHVWISEIMLQQTRVDTVIDYYQKFLQSFPSIKDLANASEEEVLKHWEGLGYYSRARNLHKTANILRDSYNSKLPRDKKSLLSLPGIGPYTCGAIMSIAFNKKEIAIDGNFIRVGSRLMAYDGDIYRTKGKRIIENFWKSLISEKYPGIFNQAVMDLGATICLPKGMPLCDKCPIKDDCRAYKEEQVLKYPIPKKKSKKKIEKKTIFLIFEQDEFIIEQRPMKGVLQGLWQFPMANGDLNLEECRYFLNSRNIQAIHIKKGPRYRHIFSHMEWDMCSVIVKADSFSVREGDTNAHWITQDQLNTLTIPRAFQPFLKEILNEIHAS